MVKKYSLLSLIVALTVSLVAACGSGNSAGQSNKSPDSGNKTPAAETKKEEPKKEQNVTAIRMGTSSSGSPFYVLTVGMGELIKKHAKINTTVEPVGGSDPNVFAIEAGKVDVAMLAAYSAARGYYGEPPFKKPVNLRLVAQGQKTFRQIIVTKKSGIKKPEDLAGKSIIAKRPAIPELEMIANAMFDVYKVPKDKVKIISTVETKEALEALNLGSVDAAILPASLGAADIMQLFENGKVEFLNLEKGKVDEMLKKLPKSMFASVIPANTYKGQGKDANVFAFSTYLVAGEKLPEQSVYEITKAILGNTKEFSAVHKEAKNWTVENTLANPKLPYHPGAIKYFKEVGKWDSKHEELQKTLEKR